MAFHKTAYSSNLVARLEEGTTTIIQGLWSSETIRLVIGIGF